MPLFRVTTYKRLVDTPDFSWSNVYTVNSLIGVNDALGMGQTIKNIERAITYNFVAFYRVTAKAVVGNASARSEHGDLGDMSGGSVANLIPLFNTVRVVFSDALRRPESKFLRGVILEANVQGFNISGELRDFIDTNYSQPMKDLFYFVGPGGETITTATTQQLIQMRQSGWHRRTRPGFKRGWVPA